MMLKKSNLFFAVYLILALCLVASITAFTPTCTDDVSKLVPLAAPLSWTSATATTSGDGASVKTSSIEFALPAGGTSSAITYNQRFNIAHIDIKFKYTMGSAPSTIKNGFAVVLQAAGVTERDGAYDNLGYRMTQTIAVEYDTFIDGQAADAGVSGPHLMAAISSGSTPASARWVAANGIAAAVCVTNCYGRVRINRSTTGLTVRAWSYAQSGTEPSSPTLNVTFPASSLSTLLLDGSAFLSFTTSSTDAAPATIAISDVNISTPGVASLVRASSTASYNSGGSSIVVSSSPTSSGMRAGFFPIDSCGNPYRFHTYESINTSAATTNMITSADAVTFKSSSTVSATSENLSWNASGQTFTSCTSGSDCHSGWRYLYVLVSSEKVTTVPVTFNAIYNGKALATQFASGSLFIAGPAVASTSKFQSLVRGTTVLTSPYTLTAGVAYGANVQLFDIYGNIVTASTSVTARATASDTSASTLMLSPSSTGVVTMPFQITNFNAAATDSTLDISIASQLMPQKINVILQAGPAYGPTSSLVSGTSQTSYIAGEKITFQLSLADQWSNPVKATQAILDGANNDFGLYLNNVEVAGSETSIVNDNWQYTVTPTVATSQSLVCIIDGRSCANLESFTLTVTPAREDVTKSKIALTSVSGSPTVTQAIVGKAVTFTLTSLDRFNNNRAIANAGSPYSVVFTSKNDEAITQTIKCDGTTSNAPIFVSASCSFKSTSYQLSATFQLANIDGYIITIQTDDGMSDATLPCTVAPGDPGTKSSISLYRQIAQTPIPGAQFAASTPLVAPPSDLGNPITSATTGDVIYIFAKLVDNYDNVVVKLSDGSPSATLQVTFSAPSATSDQTPTPGPENNGYTTTASSRQWLFDTTTQTWWVRYMVRGALKHTVSVSVRSFILSGPELTVTPSRPLTFTTTPQPFFASSPDTDMTTLFVFRDLYGNESGMLDGMTASVSPKADSAAVCTPLNSSVDATAATARYTWTADFGTVTANTECTWTVSTTIAAKTEQLAGQVSVTLIPTSNISTYLTLISGAPGSWVPPTAPPSSNDPIAIPSLRADGTFNIGVYSNEDIDPGNIILLFKNSAGDLVAPTSASSFVKVTGKAAYITITAQTAGEYTITGQYQSTISTPSATLTIQPSILDITTSLLSLPATNELSAPVCSFDNDAATYPYVILNPRDKYSNIIKYSNINDAHTEIAQLKLSLFCSSGACGSASSNFVSNTDGKPAITLNTADSTVQWAFCQTKSSDNDGPSILTISDGVTTESGDIPNSSQSLSIVFQPDEPAALTFSKTDYTCKWSNGDCCTVDDPCTITFSIQDQFNNPISPSQANSGTWVVKDSAITIPSTSYTTEYDDFNALLVLNGITSAIEHDIIVQFNAISPVSTKITYDSGAVPIDFALKGPGDTAIDMKILDEYSYWESQPLTAATTSYTFVYTIRDLYNNPWRYHSDFGTFVGRLVRFANGPASPDVLAKWGTGSPVETVQLANAAVDTTLIGQLSITLQLSIAGYYRAEFTLAGVSSKSLLVPIAPGPIATWTMSPPVIQSVKASQPWTVSITPYDALGNVVRSRFSSDSTGIKTIIDTDIGLLGWKVYEGGALTCSANVISAATSSVDRTQEANFTHTASVDLTTGIVTLSVSSQRANTVSAIGVRSPYQYYLARTPKGTTTPDVVANCSLRTNILIGSSGISVSKFVMKNLPEGPIQAGTASTLVLSISDDFDNPVIWSSDYTIRVYNDCDRTNEILNPDSAPTQSRSTNLLELTVQLPPVTTTGPDAYQFAVTLEDAVGKTEYELPAYTPDPCVQRPVYHSSPSNVILDQTAAQLDALTAGIPFELTFSSLDIYQNPIKYSDSSFLDAGRTYASFDVNNFSYQVALRYESRPNGDSTDLAQTGLQYHLTNTTSIIVIDNVIPDFQTAQLILAWPGRYIISAVIYKNGSPYLTSDGNQVSMTSSFALNAARRVCDPSLEYYDVTTSSCKPLSGVSQYEFFCYMGGVRSSVTPQRVGECECSVGLTKCPNANRCVPSAEVNTLSCSAYANETLRVCPLGYFLCGDLATCVEKEAQCPLPAAAVCPTGTVRCETGLCASSVEACGSRVKCDTNQYLCPNNLCITYPEDPLQVCPQVRECNYPNVFRCVSDGSCVATRDQCPSGITCPSNAVLCQDGTCAPSLAACQAHIPAVCTDIDRPYLCADRTCVADYMFCPQTASCPSGAPVLCPDGQTCVGQVSECNLATQCPSSLVACRTGECVSHASQCPTSTICPTSAPVRCSDGSCATTKDQCSADSVVCPASSPIRCGGRCVRSYEVCESIVSCPTFRPVKCATGECVAAEDNCPVLDVTITECSGSNIKCPITGVCAPYLAFCPTIRTCRTDETRCPDGVCYSIYGVDDSNQVIVLSDPCPTQSRSPDECASGLVQCPITNAGIVCRARLSDCPSDIVCPADQPVRCVDQSCASSIEDCQYVASSNIPTTRVPCGGGAWASSFSLCGTPVSCPSSTPVQCADGSCRIHTDDCPEQYSCSVDRPFRCADGSCQLNFWSCALTRCPSTDAMVRCPASTQQRCVDKLDTCPNVLDLNRRSEFTVKCPFGSRCWDGTCVTETRLCPARQLGCPAEAPYVCDSGACAHNQYNCPLENGCPADLPVFCAENGRCVESTGVCSSILEPTTCGEVAEGQEPLVLCSDGTCRTYDECLVIVENGCPIDAPIRCVDGQCVARPTGLGSDTVIKCKAVSDAYGACPVERPFKCPGGFCATSSTRCPIYPTEDKNVCRPESRLFSSERSSDDAVKNITCDNGSCAFTLAECPIIRPCERSEFRCPDGTCRKLDCDPSTASCREKISSLPYFGAECTATNTCPTYRPFRCQDGTCVQNSTQCIDQYPIVLNKCCGTTHTYSPGATPEDPGTCIETASACSEGPRDASSSCPPTQLRCPQGFCVPSTQQSLCNAYASLLTTWTTDPADVVVDDSDDDDDDSTVVTNDPTACPTSRSHYCSENGLCVDDPTTCETQTCSTFRCPTTGLCVVADIICPLANGCYPSKPIKCANGTCAAYPASAVGSSIHQWDKTTINGLDPEGCPASIKCDGFEPFLCGDGSCAISSDFCPPIISQCSGICSVVCPVTLQCVMAPVTDGACDYSKIADVCSFATCPENRPILCSTGSCAASLSECGSPYYDAARTYDCDAATPFRCITGECVTRPYDCIEKTAMLNNITVPSIDSAINAGVACPDLVCANGLCVKDLAACPPIDACPFGSMRCGDGFCAPATTDSTGALAAPDCSAHTVGTCPTGTQRCADGVCRAKCIVFFGCPPSRPYSCSWRKQQCTATFSECQNAQTLSAFVDDDETVIVDDNLYDKIYTSAVQSYTHYTSNKLTLLHEMSQRFTQLNAESLGAALDRHYARTLESLEATKFSTTAATPTDTQVEVCYNNCERDVPAARQTVLLSPTSRRATQITVSQRRGQARTVISVPPASVSAPTELTISPVPYIMLDGTKVEDIPFDIPTTWTTGRQPGNPDREYGAKVLSTPFHCAMSSNSTAVKSAFPITVQSYVDLAAFSTDGSSGTVTDTSYPCEFQGVWDSAVSGCGGTITIDGSLLSFDYPACSDGTGVPLLASDLTFNLTFTKVLLVKQAWTSESGESVVCGTISGSTRRFADGTMINGQQFCMNMLRVTDAMFITVPSNLVPNTEGELTADDFTTSLDPATSWTDNNNDRTINNANKDTGSIPCTNGGVDLSQIQKKDICLGYYSRRSYEWECIRESYEARTESPAWRDGQRQQQVVSSLDTCDQNAYAFIYVPLPAPTPEDDSFCFWCKYGYIILIVCIVFVAIVVIAILLALKFYRDRLKFQEEKRKLAELHDRARELDEMEGGLGVADQDGEIVMVANPLIISLRELNQQLDEANLKLNTIGQQEEYEIQKLEMQRQRIRAEIKRVNEELEKQNKEIKAQRVEGSGPSAVTTGPSAPAGGSNLNGPMRAGPSGPSAPSSNNLQGPMRAPARP